MATKLGLKTMFKSARLKLTGWYLFIIMLVSAFFSSVIYLGTIRELEGGFRRAELRLKAEELGIPLPRHFPSRLEDLPPRLQEISPRFFSVEDLEVAKKRLGLNLLVMNGVILGISALAGYFLAGKTLKPIEKAMGEQKRFVADASHELRTPLAALKTSMEVALRDKKMSVREARKLIKSNLEDIDSLESLSNNLLSLASLQNNSKNLVFGEVDIAEVIRSAYRKIIPLAREKKIEVKIQTQKQTIFANKESLEKMILIFLDNAVKYTSKEGKVTIRTKTDKKHLILEIKDTGIGIAPKDIPHIFDRFYRADQSRSREHLRGGRLSSRSHDSSDGEGVGGFGLGLSLAKRIIEIHKGSVEVLSKVGKGTTFTVKLPLKHS